MTSEIERITILEGKISQVVEFVHRLSAENEKLKQLVKDMKAEKKDFEEQGKRLTAVDEELKKLEGEKEAVKGKIEELIGQINQLGL